MKKPNLQEINMTRKYKSISCLLLSITFIFIAVSCDKKPRENGKKSVSLKVAPETEKTKKPRKIVKPAALARNKVSINDRTRIHLTFDKRDEKSFPNMKDKKNPSRIVGKVKLVDGLFDKALRTESDGFVEIAKNHTQSHVLTIEFWMKRGQNNKTTTILEAVDKNGAPGWQLDLSSSDKGNKLIWKVRRQDNTVAEIVSMRGLSDPDKWYRISLTHGGIYGGKATRIFIDGTLVASKPGYTPLIIPSGPLRVRSPQGGGIDDFTITHKSDYSYRDIKDVRLLLSNLDFEQKAKGWTGVYDSLVIDQKEKHSGKYSLRIETDDLYTREYLSPIFSVKPDAVYRISFWVKLDEFEKGYSAIGVWVRWYFAPEETCSIGGDFVANYTAENKERKFGWRKFTADVPVPRKSFYRKKIKWARLQVKNYQSKVLVWIDDIEVEEVEEVKSEQ